MRILAFSIIALALILAPLYAVRLDLDEEYDTGLGPLTSLFVDRDGIYLAGEDGDKVVRYTISEDELERGRTFSSSSGEDIMANPRDIWVQGGYLYVLDSKDHIFVFNTTNQNLVSAGTSGSYIPDDGTAIAAFGKSMLVADQGKNIIIIAEEYDKGKYAFESAISPTFLGTQMAALNEPEDIALHGGMIYVADLGSERVIVFTENYSYSNSYGGLYAEGEYDIGRPSRIAVDDYYIYAVQSDRKSIRMVSKDTKKVVAIIEDDTYDFEDITAICIYDGQLYVALGSQENLLVFDILYMESLTYAEAYSYYSNFSGTVARYCEISALSEDLGLHQHTPCSSWQETESELAAQLDSAKYDTMYRQYEDESAALLSDLDLLEQDASDELTASLGSLESKMARLQPKITSQYSETAESIYDGISTVKQHLSKEDYVSANIVLKELTARAKSLSESLGEGFETEQELLERYSGELSIIEERYDSMADFAGTCGLENESSSVSLAISLTRDSISGSMAAAAYANLTQLHTRFSSFEQSYNERLSIVSSANSSINEANRLINESRANALPLIVPDYADAEALIDSAYSDICTDPGSAKMNAENALLKVQEEYQSYEDTKLMVLFIVGVLVFLGIISVLFGAGIRNVLKILKGKK